MVKSKTLTPQQHRNKTSENELAAAVSTASQKVFVTSCRTGQPPPHPPNRDRSWSDLGTSRSSHAETVHTCTSSPCWHIMMDMELTGSDAAAASQWRYLDLFFYKQKNDLVCSEPANVGLVTPYSVLIYDSLVSSCSIGSQF